MTATNDPSQFYSGLIADLYEPLAGASFTLLGSDGDARDALACMCSHLEPGGSVLIPLKISNLPANEQAIGFVSRWLRLS